jgi:hypothetical protein
MELEMRSYDVSLFMLIDGKLVKSKFDACWAMCSNPTLMGFNTGHTTYKSIKGKDIYISRFDFEKTQKYQTLLVSIINEITPCEIVQIGAKSYIKFQMMETYDQSLVLLNFIRNLWHQPKTGYTEKFFESLEKAEQKDPLERLTWANKEACPKSILYPPGHSNVFNSFKLKVKKKQELLEYKGISVYDFLT